MTDRLEEIKKRWEEVSTYEEEDSQFWSNFVRSPWGRDFDWLITEVERLRGELARVNLELTKTADLRQIFLDKDATIATLRDEVNDWMAKTDKMASLCGAYHEEVATLREALGEIDTCIAPPGEAEPHSYLAVHCKVVARKAIAATEEP